MDIIEKIKKAENFTQEFEREVKTIDIETLRKLEDIEKAGKDMGSAIDKL